MGRSGLSKTVYTLDGRGARGINEIGVEDLELLNAEGVAFSTRALLWYSEQDLNKDGDTNLMGIRSERKGKETGTRT
jgi:hypothetical protein